MKRNTFSKVLALVLALAMLVSVIPASLAVNTPERAVSGAAGKFVISQTDYAITSGVTESQVLLNNAEGTDQVACYMMTAKPDAQVSFKASYHGYYTEGSTPGSRADKAKNLTWGMDRTTDQAHNYEKATGDKVIFATNADYYNMQTAQPLGYLVMEGNVIQTGNGNAFEPYFAVLKDGTFAIRDYGTPLDDVVEAVSGPFYLTRHGVNVTSPDDTTLAPRNAIGMKEDGSVVTCVVDGRQAPYSSGMTVWETAELMLANGVVDCIYLDGGGSATFTSVREGTDKLEVRNSPSDGPERTVASALLMVSTALSDGSFDHASIYPKNEVYTPGSSVQMEAIGADKAGAPADVPADLNWYVPVNQGTITEAGVFTAKEGYVGQVDISLRKGSTVYGTTTLQIADIDNLYFTGESISLDFDADSDLGLNAKSSKRNIHYKDGDFTWEITGENGAELGAMKGNIFHTASAESTIKGTVTVSYTKQDGTVLTDTINVEVGKLPVIMQDFEPNENGPLTAAHFHEGSNVFHYEGSPNGPGYVGNVPEMQVILGGTHSGNPTYGTVTAPYAFTGNFESAVPAAPIFNANGYTFYLWPNGTIVQYMAGGLKTISREEGGQVRSGDYSLEMDYDYASYDNSKNANFYIRYCGEEIDIEGYPTKVGVWVYAPEGTANYMLACDIAAWDSNKNSYTAKNLFLTAANGSPVINWTGWMYCSANIESLHPLITPEHPLKIRQGEGLFWLSYQPGKNLGGRYNGSLYFDDYRFVYGTDLDDPVNPQIDSVSLNGVEIAEDGSTVIDTTSVEIKALFSDPESQNRSGVDASKTVMFIDNKNIAVDGSDEEATTRTTLGNGPHTIMVQVADGDGNMATVTRSFTVAAADASNAKITVTGPEAVTLGGKYTLEVKAEGTVTNVDLTMLNINSDFCKVPVEVSFSEGVTGDSTYTNTGFKKASLVMNMTAKSEEGMTGTLATITFTIPEDVDREVDFFMYQITNITFTDKDGNEGTDAYGLVKKVVEAYYNVNIGPAILGRDVTITITDINDELAADVTVYINGTEVGKTNEKGELTTDATKAMPEYTDFIVTARSEKGLSFEAKGTVYAYAGNGNALPTSIQNVVTENASTTQTIHWFSNLAYAQEKAYVRYMTEQDYMKATRGEGPDTDYMTRRGTCEPVMFPISKSAAGFNSITLTGLTPDTTYVYWVGDGKDGNWSEKCTFHTEPETKTETTFYVLGDTQMLGDPARDEEAIATMNTVLAAVKEQGVDFGLQTGDYIDNGGTYGHYQEMLDVFQNSAVASKPLVKTLGNHEYYGDLSGNVANKVFDLPGRDYYSVETNGVYVAVINNSAKLDEAMEWLAVDAAKSECQWKFLSVHQPAYYSNVNGGSEAFHNKIPAVAEAAGIDVVFSGHDHSYARTEMLKDGRIAEDDGTYYMICGDMGEKSRNLNYAATDTPEFHFAEITQDYEAIYIVVKAAEKSLTVTAYNLDGTILDTFSKLVKEDQPDNPDKPDDPDVEHNYVYDRANNKLVCKDEGCGVEAPADYTGWATDSKSGKKMYFIGGQYKTGWFMLGEDVFHFDPKTGEMHELKNVSDVKTTCSQQGWVDVVCSCGETEHFVHSNPTGHVNEQKVSSGGSVYYVCINCGRISLYDLSFSDVEDSDWFAPNVAYVANRELFSGRTAIIFDPDTAMTRAELVTVIWRLAGRPDFENVAKPDYTDCPAGAWYTAAVNWATKNGIVNGMGKGTFQPDGLVTREQIVTVFYRYAKLTGLDTSAKGDFSKFADGSKVMDYAKEAMSWAVGSGLMQGDTLKMLNPQGNATRAEVATMVMRYDMMIHPEAE